MQKKPDPLECILTEPTVKKKPLGFRWFICITTYNIAVSHIQPLPPPWQTRSLASGGQPVTVRTQPPSPGDSPDSYFLKLTVGSEI